MEFVVEPLDYSALLMRIRLTHDKAIVQDSIEDPWVLQEDELQRIWASTIALRNGMVLPSVAEATLPWFLKVRPLMLLRKPGAWPL